MIKRRALFPEFAWVQICSEARGAVEHRPLLRSLAIPAVPPDDGREPNLVVGRLPIYGGKTIIGDVTLRSPLSGVGAPRFDAHREAGATFHNARLDKASAYPELMQPSSNFKFVVLACELGGHLSEECHTLMRQLVRHRTSLLPRHLRPFAAKMQQRRWYSMLSCAIQRAVAWNTAPDFEELCAGCVWSPAVSRMA